MADYLMSRPGRPLHLTAYAYEPAEDQPEYYLTGRTVPLCGSDRGRRWRFTGPWAERWETDRRGGLCLHCVAELDRLRDAAEAVTPNA